MEKTKVYNNHVKNLDEFDKLHKLHKLDKLINIKKLNNKYFLKYRQLFNYSIDKYYLVNENILFNYQEGRFCNDDYIFDFNTNTFNDIIYNDISKRYNLNIKYLGFDFKYLIIHSVISKYNFNTDSSNILIITNGSTILYNYNTFYNENRNTIKYKLDILLGYNSEFDKKKLEHKMTKQYPLLKSFRNILSSHQLDEYIGFLENLIYTKNHIKYNFISCNINYLYGINQTASINLIHKIPHLISYIAQSLYFLEKNGILLLFLPIFNVNIPSIKQLLSLLIYCFDSYILVNNNINQNILLGVPEYYIIFKNYKQNITSDLIDKLLYIAITTSKTVIPICEYNTIFKNYIKNETNQLLFYKKLHNKLHKKTNKTTASISNKTQLLRLSIFLDSVAEPSSKKTKKVIKKNSSNQYSKTSESDLYYIDNINIPELNAILEDESTEFRVMILSNQIESLYIGFFDMVNYHIENSIEYDAKGAPRVSDIAIKQKTVSNLRRLLEFLEYNRLPYNRHALAVLQEKQDDLLESFYNLFSPLESRIIHYNDYTSKRLDRNGWNNLGLGASYSIQSIEQHFQRMERAYRVQQNLLSSLGIDKLPAKVQYATEDMTRGLAKFIMKRFETSLPYPVISNAFIKMWECLTVSDVISTKSSKGGRYRVFHICEAPGQMILAARYFAEKKCRDITDYDWRANSLNPYNAEVKRQYGSVFSDTYGLMRGNPKKWIWGADNTGDITQVANVKWYRNYIKNEIPDLNLIIGDGGLSSGNDTIVLQRLDLAQVLMVLACSRLGGSCVIKHFTPFMPNHPDSRTATSFFVGYMYLYYLAFTELSLFKPYSSDMTSGEFYVIGKKFRGLGQDETSVLTRLYSILEEFDTNQSIFQENEIPETFKIQIAGFIKQMTDYNVIGYEKANLVLTCYKELEWTKRQKNKFSSNNDSRSQSREKMEKYLKCGDFLNEDKIEEILVPRYNKWVKMYEFV